MFFPYTYVNHDISLLHKWAEFTFVNVWCEAKKDIEYDFSLFDGCLEFKEVLMKEEYKTDPKVKEVDYITGPVRAIYEEFQKLNSTQKQIIKKKYIKGMAIDQICSNQPNYSPFHINVISKYSKNLAKLLKQFYSNLYKKGLDLAVIRNQNGNLAAHFKEFVKINDNGICPFCGLNRFRSHTRDGHEAYDHYFPKEQFPFYAVYFKNLVLTCHDCNSVYKKTTVPTYKAIKVNSKVKQKKRKAFYPYGFFSNKVNIKIRPNIINYKNFGHSDINILVKSKGNWEENKTWKDVYDIEERYKDFLINKSAGKTWLVQYIETYNDKLRANEIERLELLRETNNLFGEDLLKVPFMLACKEAGII